MSCIRTIQRRECGNGSMNCLILEKRKNCGKNESMKGHRRFLLKILKMLKAGTILRFMISQMIPRHPAFSDV